MSETPSSTLDREFGVDVAWNVASLAVLAVSGVALNLLIARVAGAEALGVFNQVLAVYVFASQLSVGGVHLSVLKHVSHRRGENERAPIVASALVLAVLLATAFALLVYAASGLVGRLLASPGVAAGVALAAPGLVFFALNKVLLNALNGASRMRAYAVFQAGRFVLILVALAGLLAAGAPAAWLAAALPLAEAALFPALAVATHRRVCPLWPPRGLAGWWRQHLSFGARGFLSGAMAEVNTRVDVLVLGVFTGDALVGVYSFAAILAEGFSQLPLVLRRNVDPLLGECFARGDTERIERHARELRRAFFPVMLGVSAAAALLYPVVLPWLAPGPEFARSVPVFAVLMAGVALNALYRPFLGVLLQRGHPGRHTLLVGALLLANLVGNLLLIPVLGLLGAAIATALVFVLEAVLIRLAARRVCGVRI